jgi:toxin ParE1/3/4
MSLGRASRISPRKAGVKVEWRPSALDDRAAIFAYLLDRNPFAAASIAEELLLAADSLATFSYRGRPGLVAGTRELRVTGPYLLVYEIDAAANCVSILRVWHGARNR